jgi:hypothetical protein
MFYYNVVSLKFLKPLFYSIFLNATKIDQVGLGDKSSSDNGYILELVEGE